MSAPQTVTQGVGYWMRSNHDLFAILPAPPETFQVTDFDRLTQGDICKMHHYSIIERVAWATDDRGIWRLRKEHHEYIRDSIEHVNFTPCGHTGIRCVEAGKTYQCTYEHCDETFGREAAMQVVE